MDQLELLKQKWQESEQELPTLSFNDIYKMLLKKSSSIVKWIFYISIGEILFWTVLALLVPESTKIVIEEMGLKNLHLIVTVLNYGVVVFFIFLFYKNHRRIQVTDSVKELMANILKTRKTVKYFVIYNVVASIILLIITTIHYYLNREKLYDVMLRASDNYTDMTPEQFNTIFFLMQILGGILLIGLVVLFYRLIYGILLKRLKNNYDELEKIEM